MMSPVSLATYGHVAVVWRGVFEPWAERLNFSTEHQGMRGYLLYIGLLLLLLLLLVTLGRTTMDAFASDSPEDAIMYFSQSHLSSLLLG